MLGNSSCRAHRQIAIGRNPAGAGTDSTHGATPLAAQRCSAQVMSIDAHNKGPNTAAVLLAATLTFADPFSPCERVTTLCC